jgi:hypothetical protein
MRRLEGPDPFAEPGEQRTPFSEAAKESLPEMNVALDQARQDQAAFDIQNLTSGRWHQRAADLFDAPSDKQ